MRMDCVDEGETKSTLYVDEDWEDNWNCSDSCLKVFREIRNGISGVTNLVLYK